MEDCAVCGGAGMALVVDEDGHRKARACECHADAQTRGLVARARIPDKYRHCVLESYAVTPTMDRSLSHAAMMARRFVEAYPVETDGCGLLMTGNIGVGKTHLAVGILLELMRTKGVRGLFWDYRELLQQVRDSYHPDAQATEMGALRPLWEAEVLVLDELGAQKPTEWVWDTLALVLNRRYNAKRTTIVTTNYADLPPGGLTGASDAQQAVREETLGDRIGERMRSRLTEMCVRVEMRGSDYRQGAARAVFG